MLTALAPRSNARLRAEPKDNGALNKHIENKRITHKPSDIGDLVSMAQRNELKNDQEVNKSTKMWLKVAHDTQAGVFSDWDKYEMAYEGAEEDYFDRFEAEMDDYGEFLKADYAECDTEVVWSPALLEKMQKDKSARGEIFRDSKAYADTLPPGLQDRHITVIYNPVGGGGKAKRLVGHMVVPILQLTRLKFKVVPTQYRCHAVELVRDLDLESTDGIIVCGGDGLVHEVITGYFQHPNQELIHKKVAPARHFENSS